MLFPSRVSCSAASTSKVGLRQTNVFLIATTTCMLLLCWRSTGSFVTTARAWSATSFGSGRFVQHSTRNFKSFSSLAAGAFGENETTGDGVNGNTPKQPEGKTGWNHNPPKNPDFWNPESQAEQVEAIAKSIQPEQPKYRTGWLHNKASPTAKAGTAKSSSEANKKKKSNAAGKARRRLEEAMKSQRENHRIVAPGALHACGKDRLVVVTEHRMSVPLVHPEEQEEPKPTTGMPSMRKPPTESIDVAFTIVEEIKDEETRIWYETVFSTLTPQQRAAAYVKRSRMTSAKDMILYLQGGPGFGAPTPIVGMSFAKGGGSWGSAALDRYSKVVLMDQRGTGNSSPLTKQTLERRFPGLFAMDSTAETEYSEHKDHVELMSSLENSNAEGFQAFHDSLEEATSFMSRFRADSIVRDAELIKNVLMYSPSVDDEDDDDDSENAIAQPNPWGCSLGQSFGGFCTMTYLSQIKNPPKIALLTGGVAPIMAHSPVDVYTALWKKVRERNHRYYEMYPGDVAVVKTIVRKLLESEAEGASPRLPSGGKLTARRFLQLGMMLGGGPSSFASMHSLLSSAFLQPLSSKDDALVFSRGFLKAVDNQQSFDEHPIYFWLHESIYADSNNKGERGLGDNAVGDATSWSANSAYQGKVSQRSFGMEYDYANTCQEKVDLPVLFFGEMVFPWMTEDYAELGGLGCTALAHALANKNDWGPLYDAPQMRTVLGEGRTRSAAAIYYDDIYVDFDYAMQATARGGPLEKCKVYISNEYQHSGLRDDGAVIFNKLHGMATGSIQTPS